MAETDASRLPDQRISARAQPRPAYLRAFEAQLQLFRNASGG